MPNYMTQATFERISNELKEIHEVEIPKISKAKRLAAEEGDLSENAEYIACKEKLEMLHARFDNLKQRIANPNFIDNLRIPGTIVSIGTKVGFEDLDSGSKDEYQILGSADANLEEGIISFSSPLAKGLIGKKEGQEIEIKVPDGIKKVKVLSIKKFNAD